MADPTCMPARDAEDDGLSAEQAVAEAVRLCREGRSAEAELTLHGLLVSERPSAEAAELLEALLIRRGARREAEAVRRRFGVESERRLPPALSQPPTSGASQLGFEAEQGSRSSAVEPWASRVRLISPLVRSLELRPRPSLVGSLRELLAAPADDRRLTPQVRVRACEALTRLAMLAGDEAEATCRLRQGQSLDPWYVPLSLLEARLARDASEAASSLATLSRTEKRYPDYPDLKAMLVRQAVASGNRALGRDYLRRWRADRPDDPMLAELSRELAA